MRSGVLANLSASRLDGKEFGRVGGFWEREGMEDRRIVFNTTGLLFEHKAMFEMFFLCL